MTMGSIAIKKLALRSEATENRYYDNRYYDIGELPTSQYQISNIVFKVGLTSEPFFCLVWILTNMCAFENTQLPAHHVKREQWEKVTRGPHPPPFQGGVRGGSPF
jgi:hypothetical protein